MIWTGGPNTTTDLTVTSGSESDLEEESDKVYKHTSYMYPLITSHTLSCGLGTEL